MDCHPTHVLDTSVCIDLYWGGLIGACLDLPFHFTIPDFIRDELTEPAGLVAGWDRIEVTPLTGDQISRVYVLKQDKRCRLLTVNDLAALVLAKDISATLLTNDGALRLLAAEHGVIATVPYGCWTCL
ncbi:MAG TPA: PIN domain-containing protein [Firmicutes bacterium]|nr:PIN domain-containing protein [Candidatus Fermentithermobacillaceae bacterium]